MSRLSFFTGAVIAVALVVSGQGVAFSEPSQGSSDKFFNWTITERLREQQSYSTGRHINSAGAEQAIAYCTTYEGKTCSPSNTLTWNAGVFVAPVCNKRILENCIDFISIYRTGQTPVHGSLIGMVEGNSLEEQNKFGLPFGATTSLWSQPGISNASGSTNYSVLVRLTVRAISNSPVRYAVQGFRAYVMPYFEEPGGEPHRCEVYSSEVYDIQVGCGGISEGYAWSGNGKKGKIVSFSENTRVRIALRLSKSVSGWFAGRAKDPTIEVAKYSATQNLITLDAAPVDVPQLNARVDVENADKKLKTLYKNCPEFQFYGWCGTISESSWASSFQAIDAYRNFIDDAATGLENMWSFSSLPNMELNSCLSDTSKVMGVVTTNSMAYEGTAPKFKGGFLNYNLAGMHFLQDKKTPALGTYDLVMRSDVARCLYGFSKAPLSASVSVVNEKGTKTTATTVVSEKNGWLKMAAYGFTFSKKTIKVKITKKKK